MKWYVLNGIESHHVEMMAKSGTLYAVVLLSAGVLLVIGTCFLEQFQDRRTICALIMLGL